MKTRKMTVAELEEFCREECKFLNEHFEHDKLMRICIRGTINGMYKLWQEEHYGKGFGTPEFYDSWNKLKEEEFPLL